MKNRGRSFSNSFFRIYRVKEKSCFYPRSFISSSKFTNSIFHSVLLRVKLLSRICEICSNFCTKIFCTCIKSHAFSLLFQNWNNNKFLHANPSENIFFRFFEYFHRTSSFILRTRINHNRIGICLFQTYRRSF